MLCTALAAAMLFPSAVLQPVSAEAAIGGESAAAASDDTKKLPGKSGTQAVNSVPRINYKVPFDSWERDFTMSEENDYYYCTIPSLSSQFYIYDKTNGSLSGSGYAGIDALDEASVSKNINVAFSAVDGSRYKKASASSSAGSSTVDIRVDKQSGLIYGVCGVSDGGSYAEDISLQARTSSNANFTVCSESDPENERYQIYTFSAASVDFKLMQGSSAAAGFTYDTSGSLLNGAELSESASHEYYTASVSGDSGCDTIKIYVDKALMTVTAKAAKSGITEDENRTYYVEGRFAFKTADDDPVSVNGSAWSDNSAAAAFSPTETSGLYKLDTNSTIAELTALSGAAYSLYVREGTQFPKTALGTCYAPSANTSLAAVSPGQKLSAAPGQTAEGGFYFNNSENNSGKVTLWFDITDPCAPCFYYTVRFDGISAKAMCYDENNELIDKESISVSIEPNGTVSLPEGALVSAPEVVEENGTNYSFTSWITINETGSFEDSTAAQTTFFPTEESEIIAAVYKKGYSITCESNNRGTVTPSASLVGESEKYSLTIEPQEHYTLTSLIVDGVEQINNTIGRTSYEGVMGDHSITVKAEFSAAREVYFYAAVPTSWGDGHRKIAATADGAAIEPEEIFDNVVLYDYNSSTAVNGGKTFYVNVFKAEIHSIITLGHPENDDGTVDSNCYGHKLLSGSLSGGRCYYYYSEGIGKNRTGVINSARIETSCLTEKPTSGSPVELSFNIKDCNGKTAGQEEYTPVIYIQSPDGFYKLDGTTFTPETPGSYNIHSWAEVNGAKSSVMISHITVYSPEPEPHDITVEFKYYGRDNNDQLDLSETESTISIDERMVNNSLEETLANAYNNAQNDLKATENVMCEYYFNISQKNAVNAIKEQTNYHEIETDNNEILRDENGIAEYYNYNDSYPGEKQRYLQYHTDRYGIPTNEEKWVTFYDENGDEVSESIAYASPDTVARAVIWGFNNPKMYDVNLTYADESDPQLGPPVDDGLYEPIKAVSVTYKAFYNMLLSPTVDYSDGGYLSNYALEKYYGNAQSPTALKTILSDDYEYVFDGWYEELENGKMLKISADDMYSIRVSNDVTLTALYRESTDIQTEPSLTMTGLDHEKYSENGTDKIRITNIANVFNSSDTQRLAIVYARFKEDDFSDDFVRDGISELLNDTSEDRTGRVSGIYSTPSADYNVLTDIYEIVPDSKDADAENYKIVLNNKSRIPFTTSFSAQSAQPGGGNYAVYVYAAIYDDGKWILSENYIPYINTGTA